MKLSALAAGAEIFVDSNIFVYQFGPSSKFGPATVDFMQRVENREVSAFTSTHVLGEAVHKLLGLEACAAFTWPNAGLASRLKKHPTEVQKLFLYRKVVDDIPRLNIQVLAVQLADVTRALDLIQRIGILVNDALTVAVMEAQGITNVASNDSDFDRVAGLTRFEPT